MATGASSRVAGDRRHLRRRASSPATSSSAGEVGYFTASHQGRAVRPSVGDTVTDAEQPRGRAAARLPRRRSRWSTAAFTPADGCRVSGPARRAGEAPAQRRFADLRAGDPPSRWASASAAASSGMLHMEIIQERLEREFDLDLITTAAERHLPVSQRPTAPWS